MCVNRDEDESSFDSSKIDPLALAMLGVAPAKKLKHAVVLGMHDSFFVCHEWLM